MDTCWSSNPWIRFRIHLELKNFWILIYTELIRIHHKVLFSLITNKLCYTSILGIEYFEYKKRTNSEPNPQENKNYVLPIPKFLHKGIEEWLACYAVFVFLQFFQLVLTEYIPLEEHPAKE